MKKKRNVGTLAFAFIAILCLSLFPAFMPKVNAKQSSGVGGPTVTQLWKFTPISSEVYTPVVKDGFVYVTSQDYGGLPTGIICIGASTGNQIWNQTGLFDMFTVSNGYIYVGDQSVVSCLNAYNGVRLWNYTTGNAVSSSPVVVGSTVYVDGYNLNGRGGLVYAFNSSTGKEIWSYSSPAGTRFGPISFTQNGNVLETSLVVSSGYVYAVSSGTVFALNASTGEEIWNYTTSGQLSSLIAEGNKVFVNCNYANATTNTEGDLLALEAQNGLLIWNHTSSYSVGSSIFANETVYVVSSSDFVYALNALNGAVIWNYTTDSSLGSALIANDYLYVASSAGVICFDASNGTVIWNFEAPDFADSYATNPTYVDGVVYVGWNGPMFFSPVTQHNFYALDGLSGKKLWNYTIGSTVASTPVVVGGTVYIAANFLTAQSPDLVGAGAVLALKPEMRSSPFSTTDAAIIVIVIALILISTAVFMHRKKLKTKPHCPMSQLQG